MQTERGLGSILITTDFSAGARVGLDRAARLPLRPDARIALLHVLPEEDDLPTAERLVAGARRRLEKTRSSAARMLEGEGKEDCDVLVSVAHGKPFVEIIRQARAGKADLIVVGRHGERTFREMLIGSTVERVIRKGDVSVLVVNRASQEKYRRPLVAVDMSESSRLALELALRICDPADGTIDVVHVVSLPSPARNIEVALVPDIIVRRLEEEQSARTKLSEFLHSVDATGRWNIVLKSGDPREVILEEARSRRSDLIVMGTKGRTGLAHVLVGSIAEGVLRAASTDVLVARLPRADFHLP